MKERVCGLLMAGVVLAAGVPLYAQNDAKAPAQDKQTQAQESDADARVVGQAEVSKSKAQMVDDAWALLHDALTDDKHVAIRIQGMAALGTMGNNPRSLKMIKDGFADKDLDVRSAAILAAGQAHARTLIPEIKQMLNDKEPQVNFVAASTLWKMGDHAGEDLLVDVVNGDRKANASLVQGGMYQANRELHDPAALAKIGALEGASLLLGPFGFGITAYEYVKKNGGDSGRVTAIEEIAQEHTPEMHRVLLDALGDKDPGVRAAAAKAVRWYHDAETQKALAGLFGDSKRPVQLAGAAAYLIAAGVVAQPPAEPLRP